MFLVIDNYDSFTYNLVHYFRELGAEVTVVRNDALSVAQAIAQKPTAIVLSPGPGRPEQAGICLDLIEAAATRKLPLLGVCLGHQAIGQAFGGKIVSAPTLMHGKVSSIEHENTDVFQAIPSPFEVTRYHSLIVDKATIPAALKQTAWTSDGLIMGLRHKE
ncbi:MAG: aminodeoxychorismate/anthranilate synthase component II, partial [Pseudomonadota bacterium]